MGRQSELIDGSGKTQKVNVQDIKIMYLVDGLMQHLPDKKILGMQPSIIHTQNS